MNHSHKSAADKAKRPRRGSKLFTLIEQKDKDLKDKDAKDTKELKESRDKDNKTEAKEETSPHVRPRSNIGLSLSQDQISKNEGTPSASGTEVQRASSYSLLRIKKKSTPITVAGSKKENDFWIPLATAVKTNNARMLYDLLQQGVDVNMTDKDGQTALHLAAAEKEVEGGTLLVLLAFQANIHLVDSKKWTPLHVACNTGNWKVCKLLLDRGADAKAEAMGRIQPLHYLARTAPTSSTEMDDYLEVLATLIARGASLNHQTDFGETVLHYCAYGKGSKDVVRWLLKKGADPNLKDRKGASPLHIAVMQKRIPMIKLLLAHGADRNLHSDWGTPIDLAKRNPTLQIILARDPPPASLSLEDPRDFLKNIVAKELANIQTNVALVNCSNHTLQQTIQANIEELIEKINSWTDRWTPASTPPTSSTSSASSTPSTDTNMETTQQLSSEEIILAVGRGIPSEKTNRRKSPTREETEPEADSPFFEVVKAKVSSIGPYHLGGLVGSGAVGKVFKGFNKDDGEFVAVKEINLANVEGVDRKKVLREVQILKQLNHENIVKYIDCHQEGETALYVIMEFIEAGTLKDAVKKFGKFPETLVSKLLNKIVDSIVYIHSRGIVHRDIKGANIMLTKEGSCKLTDFGIANQFQAGQKLVSCVGTPCWMAPELIAGEGYGPACDIWSLGCLAIELLTGSPPFSEVSPMFAMFRIVEVDDVKNPVPLPSNISPEMQSFIQSCLKRNPAARLTAEQLKRHTFLRKYDLMLPHFIPVPYVSPRSASTDQLHQHSQSQQMLNRINSSNRRSLPSETNRYRRHTL